MCVENFKGTVHPFTANRKCIDTTNEAEVTDLWLGGFSQCSIASHRMPPIGWS